MSIMVATGRAAQMGILFRDAEAIEGLRSFTTLVVDKTGTLTEGKPKVTQVLMRGAIDEASALRFAASLETQSEHPIARAIIAEAKDRDLSLWNIRDFQSATGKGVHATVEGHRIVLGNEAMMKQAAVALAEADLSEVSSLQSTGATVMFLAVDGALVALIAVSDPIKKTTAEAIADLHNLGIAITMLTGDSERTAQHVAKQLRIDHVIAEAPPEAKLKTIAALQSEGRIVAMAGDGINDSPALAKADVGIAMGTGTDAAMQSAAITLVKGDLSGIVRGRRLAEATMRNIKQNLWFAFGYNALGITVASGALYPLTGWLLSPMIAAAAMSLSSVSVIGNSLRLRATKLK
jgi:Cu+-exporting ATPase